MLVLTRKIGEAIVIDDQTTIRLIHIDKGRVRLAIEAPKEVRVHREEVQERINAMPPVFIGKPGRA